MSDQAQHGAVKLQSSAMVAAAFITTLGAITAALIQTGWISKPPVALVSHMQPPAPIAKASFLGTIEPAAERPSADTVELRSDTAEPTLSIPSSIRGNETSPPNPTQSWPADASSSDTMRQSTVHWSPFRQTAYQLVRPAQFDSAPPQAVPQPALVQQSSLKVESLASVAPSTIAPLAPIAAAKETAGYAAIPPAQATLLADDGAVKILPSPWSFLTQPTTIDKPAPKAPKKPIDWGSVARWFGGHD
ncbi:MAG TPA: hypothetical protein VFE46_02225 [Pirellulales bacterium]|jgi:hypothetical protein|nr:hypothetical protein [Pirellulales bacterium]